MSELEKLEYIHKTLVTVGDGPASFEMVLQAVKYVEQLINNMQKEDE